MRYKLNHRIQLTSNVSENPLASDWQVVRELFASVAHLNPTRVKFFGGVKFGDLVNEAYTMFAVRFAADISMSMRVVFKGREFAIKKIVNVEERDQFLELICLEVS